MGFVFKNYARDIDVAGKDFKIICDADMGDLIYKLGQEAQNLSEEVRSGTKTQKDVLTMMKNSINQLLGDGAVKRIFEGRKITTTDCVDVILYIAQTVADVQKELRG